MDLTSHAARVQVKEAQVQDSGRRDMSKGRHVHATPRMSKMSWRRSGGASAKVGRLFVRPPSSTVRPRKRAKKEEVERRGMVLDAMQAAMRSALLSN